MKRVHYLQHVEFENIGYINNWVKDNSYSLTGTRFYLGESCPEIESFDILFIMGGPMNIYESDKYSWLKEEKKFIKKAIESGKKVVGFCLGAQLIADVLGAKVYKNSEKEIGWFEIEMFGNKLDIAKEKLTVFHWHGDTFGIPVGAELLCSSKACVNQGFIYGDNVLAMQFHLEMEEKNIELIIENSRDELEESGNFIQSIEQIKKGFNNIKNTNSVLIKYLEKLVNK